MFKGLIFFVRQGWKYDKCYILWMVLYQFVNSMIPVIAALAPKYIIDELMGEARPQMLMLYVGVLAGYTLIAGGLYAHRRRAFRIFQHGRLYQTLPGGGRI